jgi:hypothetical protein
MKVPGGFRLLFLNIFLLLSLYTHSFAQGYNIKVFMEGLSGDTLILGEYFTSRMIPKDTVVLDRKGTGVFQGEKPFTGGRPATCHQGRYG